MESAKLGPQLCILVFGRVGSMIVSESGKVRVTAGMSPDHAAYVCCSPLRLGASYEDDLAQTQQQLQISQVTWQLEGHAVGCVCTRSGFLGVQQLQ